MNPLIDYTTKTTDELLELNKEYTKKLYNISGTNPLYNHILALRDQVQMEYGERMQMQLHRLMLSTATVPVKHCRMSRLRSCKGD